MKKLRTSKTFWVNLIMAVTGALGGIMGTDIIASNPEYVALGTMVVGLVNVVLRYFTSEPVK